MIRRILQYKCKNGTIVDKLSEVIEYETQQLMVRTISNINAHKGPLPMNYLTIFVHELDSIKCAPANTIEKFETRHGDTFTSRNYAVNHEIDLAKCDWAEKMLNITSATGAKRLIDKLLEEIEEIKCQKI